MAKLRLVHNGASLPFSDQKPENYSDTMRNPIAHCELLFEKIITGFEYRSKSLVFLSQHLKLNDKARSCT